MSNILQNIISLFSSVQIDISNIEENYSELKIQVHCNNGKIPSKKDFLETINEINIRDSLHISLLQDDEVVENFSTTQNEDFDDYISVCRNCLISEEFDIIITVTKNNKGQNISVYYPDIFFKYLSNLHFRYFLDVISNSLNGGGIIIFEIQDSSFLEFSTKIVRFCPLNSDVRNNEVRKYTERLEKIKNICHCSVISNYQFTPDDFFPQITSENPILENIFSKISLLYSIVFLFDIVNIDMTSEMEYKLSGYRTINEKINISNLHIHSCKLYYEIYSWVYEGGNIIDKIGLARNIISLNLDKENLRLSESTFEAIRSGYKIYQKENIKQYIEIRNKISDQLIELQNKADKIVDGFIGDFKKSSFTVVSFFITVIAIRVISKGDFSGGFTVEVTFLSLGFLLISLCFMFFARWEISKQMERYEKFYKHLKERYEDLLDKSDIKRILNNDKDFESNKQFIKKKLSSYTILWILSLTILFIIVISLFCINHPCLVVDGFVKLIQKLTLCFTKSI